MRYMLIAFTVLGIAALAPVHAANAAQSSALPTNKMTSQKKPQKGVIYIKTKKFMSCRDWGRDRGWCSKHAQ